MKIEDIEDKKMILSNFGTIITGEKEYSIDEFEKLINDGEDGFEPLEFSFDVKNQLFTIKAISKSADEDYDDDYEEDYDAEDFEADYYDEDYEENYADGESYGVSIYTLNLASRQKSLFEQGIIDATLQRLMSLAEKSQYKKKQRDIHAEVLKTGEYPTSKEGIKAYKDYLQEQLIRTNTTIVANRIAAVSPVVSMALFALLVKAAGVSFDYNNLLLAFLSITGAVLTGGYTFLGGGYVLFNDESPRHANKKLKKDLKLLKQKIEDLEGLDKDKDLFDVSLELTPEGLEKDELDNTSRYKNIFLQEVDEVKKLVAKLPMGERKQYVQSLTSLLTEYIQKAEVIIEKDNKKVELGTASHIWELNSQMLPDVYRLRGRVEERLSTINEKAEMLGDFQEIKKSLESLNTEATFETGYTKGYTEGYTEGYGSSGVAYASQEDAGYAFAGGRK